MMQTIRRYLIALALFSFPLLWGSDTSMQARFIPSKLNFPPPIEELGMPEEMTHSDWVKEYRLGLAFAKKREMSLALQSFKRAEALVPEHLTQHQELIIYARLFVEYLNSNYKQVIAGFEKTSLLFADQKFIAYHDLIFMLYECYERVKSPQKSSAILERISKQYPDQMEELLLSQALIRQDIDQIHKFSFKSPKRLYIKELAESYQKKLKSPRLAKWLGVICPGAGYLYAGQPRSATTSFLINGVLIAASAQLFISQLYTLGFLVATFEAGWYIGGILGGKEAVKSYNQYLYQDFESRVTLEERIHMEQEPQYEI